MYNYSLNLNKYTLGVLMPNRHKRRELILELVSSHSVSSQRELAGLLAGKGVSVTQATLSRDIRELGLVKAHDGANGLRYLPSNPVNGTIAAGPVVTGIECSGNLLVVRTRPGFAQSVAAGLDQARWPEVLGTVGGDDTVLVVLAESATPEDVRGRMQLFLSA
jgi:transcriptional regulator of arginine metabolism